MNGPVVRDHQDDVFIQLGRVRLIDPVVEDVDKGLTCLDRSMDLLLFHPNALTGDEMVLPCPLGTCSKTCVLPCRRIT
jgi:hypothetical protein